MIDDSALHQQLGRIEGKLDSVSSAISRAHERLDKHDERIGGLEKATAKIATYITVAATVVSTVVALAMKKFFGI